MNWRWYLFWLKDLLTGGKVYEAYKDIKGSYYDNNIDVDKDINNLLNHACNTTEFYKNYKGKNIVEFPVVNKSIINNNFAEIQSNKFIGENLHKMTTSGSTGTPFTVVQDKRKRRRVIAAVVFFGKICGYAFGQRQMFLRVWVKSIRKSKIKKFLQNMITEDISSLDDNKMKEISDILENDKKLRNILSYASTLEKLTKYLEEKDIKVCQVQSIISGSELLKEEVREKLKERFKNCNVVSRYANEENGILAQDCVENNHEMHLNVADYYFEFLKLNEDKPASEGEIARIVVTDLWNYALPMIRYDTGDLAIVGTSECSLSNKKVIKEIFGRKVDLIYNTDEKPVSPHMITNNMWGIENVKQFKFIQKGKKEYELLINLKEKEGVNKELIIAKFKKILGQDANVSVKYVDEIPTLKSGKVKYIENLYKG